MIMRDPGEKVENFKVVIFAIKIFLWMQDLTWSSMVLLSSLCVSVLHTLVKTNLKILPMDIFETSGRYESHFRTGCLWHIYCPYMHGTHIVRFFNFNLKNGYFSLHLIFLKLQGNKL